MWSWLSNYLKNRRRTIDSDDVEQDLFGTRYTAMPCNRPKKLFEQMLEEQGFIRVAKSSVDDLFKIKMFDRIKVTDPVVGVFCKSFLSADVFPSMGVDENDQLTKEVGLTASYLFFALVELPFHPSMLDYPLENRLQYCGEISLLQTDDHYGEDDPYRQVLMPDTLSSICKMLGSKTLIQEIGLEQTNSMPDFTTFDSVYPNEDDDEDGDVLR